MVARAGQVVGGVCSQLPCASCCKERFRSSPAASLGMASETMAESIHVPGLRRAVHGEDVPYCCGCILKVAGGHTKWDLLRPPGPSPIFAANGLPEQLVTDNGPQFVSVEFAAFLKMNGTKYIRCSSLL